MKDNDIAQMGWHFDNTYKELPPMFFKVVCPDIVQEPQLTILNYNLAKALGLNAEELESVQGQQILSGNQVPEGAFPLAQAYAGHQFGHFAKLGDGRATLLGEQITPNNERVDIQLKGSGRTPYSRGGDGKASLGPMLREYIISEAMYSLGIPTTRSLAVVTTGEQIARETIQQGAVLTRTASSHLRVGTFEYAARWGSLEELRSLADYAIQRHYPSIKQVDNPYLKLLEEVIDRQAYLVSKWNLVGFIHGVMNTDNVTISGETIDYGPCAFMDTYKITTVFSSIDQQGRYAYGNQAPITGWNMARFAETLLPLIQKDRDMAIKQAQEAVSIFSIIYRKYWEDGMCSKLGIFEKNKEDRQLIHKLLQLMQRYKADYTNTFKALTVGSLDGIEVFKEEEFREWHSIWKKRLEQQNYSYEEIQSLMKRYNPAVIPRNHLVEKALLGIVRDQDDRILKNLLHVLQLPYAYTQEQEEYSKLQEEPNNGYRTYCGT